MSSAGRIIPIICGCIMILVCILYIVSNAVPQWGIRTVGTAEGTVGLWRICASDSGESGCLDFTSTCSEGTHDTFSSACNKMMAARVFITTACIISALSALCLLVCGIIRTDLNRSVMITSIILPFISLVAGLIGVAVGIAFVTNSPFECKIHAAAIIGIVAVVINAIGAICAIFAVMVR